MVYRSSQKTAVRVGLTRIILVTLLGAALWLFASVLARAEVRILASPGGQVGDFLDLFEEVRNSGDRVVIDGPCLSACTLVLSIVPSQRICVTRRAVLGFHAARSIDRREDGAHSPPPARSAMATRSTFTAPRLPRRAGAGWAGPRPRRRSRRRPPRTGR